MSISACKLIPLPKVADERGLLGIVEGDRHVPFPIKRVFYLYDVPENKSRGSHAHKVCQQFIIGFGGGFEVTLHDGKNTQVIQLENPTQGLYIPPMIWTTVEKFNTSSICLVLTSEVYDEADYYRDYATFLADVNLAEAV